jgi:hypothetical protein
MSSLFSGMDQPFSGGLPLDNRIRLCYTVQLGKFWRRHQGVAEVPRIKMDAFSVDALEISSSIELCIKRLWRIAIVYVSTWYIF